MGLDKRINIEQYAAIWLAFDGRDPISGTPFGVAHDYVTARGTVQKIHKPGHLELHACHVVPEANGGRMVFGNLFFSAGIYNRIMQDLDLTIGLDTVNAKMTESEIMARIQTASEWYAKIKRGVIDSDTIPVLALAWSLRDKKTAFFGTNRMSPSRLEIIQKGAAQAASN